MTDISKLSTYQAGVHQARAYRAFKNMKNSMLSQHSLSMMQWYVLGYVYDAGTDGVRTTSLARDLDTTQAFITNIVNALEAKGFVSRSIDPSDSRAKKVVINQSKTEQVLQIEQELRQQMRTQLYSNISREDLVTYMRVTEKFSEKAD